MNPRQIPIVNSVYRPTDKEIKNAKDVIAKQSAKSKQKVRCYCIKWKND
ncbi:hypothetical protein MGH68_15615 [Erysipelothrix sp. D19-032]